MSLLKNLFRGKSSTKTALKKKFQPTMESLEERKVMSASSLNIHAVTQSDNTSAVFFINKQNNAFYEIDSAGTHLLSGANTIKSFSAGVDIYGKADAFGFAGDNSVWEHSSVGWQKLYEPKQMIELAAVKDGRAYAVAQDHSLWEYSHPYLLNHHLVGGWQELSGANTVRTIDAVTQSNGNDAIFAIMQNNTLERDISGSWTYLAQANYFHSDISAGLDQNGNADVFGRSNYNDQIWRYTTSAGWTAIGTAGLASQISATNAGQVDLITTNGKLDKFDAQGTLHILDSTSSFTEISAAASNDVFTVIWNYSIWERNAGGNWKELSGPGTAK